MIGGTSSPLPQGKYRRHGAAQRNPGHAQAGATLVGYPDLHAPATLVVSAAAAVRGFIHAQVQGS